MVMQKNQMSKIKQTRGAYKTNSVMHKIKARHRIKTSKVKITNFHLNPTLFTQHSYKHAVLHRAGLKQNKNNK